MRLLRFGVLLLIFMTTLPVHAKSKNKQAVDLFELGRNQLRLGKTSDALVLFRRSHAIEPAFDTLFKIAFCEAGVGQLLDSLRHFREVASSPMINEGEREYVSGKIAELETRIPRLIIVPPEPLPTGMVVFMDGKVVDATQLGTPIQVDPGERHVVATVPNHGKFENTIFVEERRRKEVFIELKPLRNTGTSPTYKVFAAGAAVVGVVCAAVGIPVLIDADLNRRDAFKKLEDSTISQSERDAESKRYSAARGQEVLGAVLGPVGVGVAVAGVGGYFKLKASSVKAQRTVTFFPFFNGPGLSMVGTF